MSNVKSSTSHSAEETKKLEDKFLPIIVVILIIIAVITIIILVTIENENKKAREELCEKNKMFYKFTDKNNCCKLFKQGILCYEIERINDKYYLKMYENG